jgi:hypothetical protein
MNTDEKEDTRSLREEGRIQKTFMKRCRAVFLYRLGRSLWHNDVWPMAPRFSAIRGHRPRCNGKK